MFWSIGPVTGKSWVMFYCCLVALVIAVGHYDAGYSWCCYTGDRISLSLSKAIQTSTCYKWRTAIGWANFNQRYVICIHGGLLKNSRIMTFQLSFGHYVTELSGVFAHFIGNLPTGWPGVHTTNVSFSISPARFTIWDRRHGSFKSGVPTYVRRLTAMTCNSGATRRWIAAKGSGIFASHSEDWSQTRNILCNCHPPDDEGLTSEGSKFRIKIGKPNCPLSKRDIRVGKPGSQSCGNGSVVSVGPAVLREMYCGPHSWIYLSTGWSSWLRLKWI